MINRFDQKSQYDFSFNTPIPQLPELNGQLLDEILGAKQQGLDTSYALSKQLPKALNTVEDRKILDQYKAEVDQGIQQVTDAYSRSVREGMAADRSFRQKVQSDWTQGGKAWLLNTRADNFEARRKENDTFYKDDKRGVNKFLSEQQLLQELNAPIQYDPNTRNGKTDFTVEKNNDVDIRTLADNMLKEIKENGTTQFLGDFNRDYWIQKITTETREPERIKLAFQALADQPDTKAQLQRDAQYQVLKTDKDQYTNNFNKGLDSNYNNLLTTSKDAQTSKEKTKDWQRFLNQQGYDVSVDGDYGAKTKEATKQLLDETSTNVQKRKDGFNFEAQVGNDVYKNYEDYALRGAYRKEDKDLVYNRAIADKAKMAADREANRINRQRMEYEFAPKDNSNIFVGTGEVQQIPDFLEYAKERQDVAKQADTNFKTALKGTAFNGWDASNIAQAYSLWEQADGDKTKFEQLLRGNSDFNFTPQQIDALHTELSLPQTESGIKTLMTTHQQAQEEVANLNEVTLGVSEQYIKTKEGKESVNMLRESAPEKFKNLSDDELVQQAIQNPNDFETSFSGTQDLKINPALSFKDRMKGDIPKQKDANYNFNGLATFDVIAGKTDKTLRPILENYLTFVEDPSNKKNVLSFGQTGMKFFDRQGNEFKNPASIDMGNMSVSVNSAGQPIVSVRGKAKDGAGATKEFYSEIELVPGSVESEQVKRGLKAAMTVKYAAGETQEIEAMSRVLNSMEGDNGVRTASRDVMVKNLNRNNTERTSGFYLKDPNDPKSAVDVNSLGWRTRDLGTEEINGITYEQVGILTPDGKKYTALATYNANGQRIFVPDTNGDWLHNTTSKVNNTKTVKRVLSEQPVQVTTTKQ